MEIQDSNNFLDNHVSAFFKIYPEIEKYKNLIFFVYAGLNFEYSFDNYKEKQLVNDIIKEFEKGKKKIVFLNLDETIISKDIDKIHYVLNKIPIKSSSIFYVCSGLNAEEEYNNYVKEHSVFNKINIISVSFFEQIIKEKYEIDYEIKLKNKLFLSFNRNPRIHRLILLSKILKNNLLNKSFYSFTGEYDDNLLDILYINEDEKSPLIKYKNKIPLILNNTVNENCVTVQRDDLKYFQDSYFSLVTETLFHNSLDIRNNVTKINSVFLSEKIFKSISVKHPFILVGQYNSLKNLKKLGYKTFHPLINESYDEIKNDDDRMNAIIEELIRLSKFSFKKWIKFQNLSKSIIDYNYDLYYSKLQKNDLSIYRITKNIENLFN